MKNKYTAELKLEHNERPAKINAETGEVSEIVKRPNNIPEGKQIFEPTAIFKKNYTTSWKWLKANTTHLQFIAAIGLSYLAKANTNSLEPINDETALKDLSELLDISKNRINNVLKKLFELGVYGRFEVRDPDKPYTKYWILNPFLSFSGKLITSDIAELFKGTHIAKAFKDENYKQIP